MFVTKSNVSEMAGKGQALQRNLAEISATTRKPFLTRGQPVAWAKPSGSERTTLDAKDASFLW